MTSMKRNRGCRSTLLTEEEVEVAEILLNLPKLCRKSELVNRYSFIWGTKKKRSAALDPISESSSQEAEADKNPSTTLSLGSDRLSAGTVIKRKATDDLMEIENRMQQEKQEKEIFMRNIKTMETQHQKLASENIELKPNVGQKINNSRNMEDFHMWNSPMKVIDQQRCHEQITMFAPPTPQQSQHCLQPLVAVSTNQSDPGVKIHGKTYDFMGLSQQLDQSKYLVMDEDIRVKG